MQELIEIAKPILFNTEMVRTILDGRKTQTRRVIKNPNKVYRDRNEQQIRIEPQDDWYKNRNYCIRDFDGGWCDLTFEQFLDYTNSKYKVGDILYVREIWTLGECFNISPETDYYYIRNDLGNKVFYKADITNNFYDPDSICKWKPSIHMPKKYARIFLKVKNVRVERLQDITLKDILREGVQGTRKTIEEVKKEKCQVNTLIPNWIELWNSTAKQGYKWEDNPYVFVYEFERVENVS